MKNVSKSIGNELFVRDPFINDFLLGSNGKLVFLNKADSAPLKYPADAAKQVKAIADLILEKNGGAGCVRELVDEYLVMS